MKLRVLYFGIVREKLGKSEETIDARDGLTAGDFLTEMADRYPDLGEGVIRLRVACNSEYVDSDAVLSDEDEIAIIPPVSGGRRV